MGKTVALVAGLVSLCALSAPAAASGGRDMHEDGCRTKVVRREGKLVRVRLPIGVKCGTPYLDGGPQFAPRRPLVTIWQLHAEGKVYMLELPAGSKDLWKRAAELVGKQVIVTGILSGGQVVVRDLKADPTVRLTGKLIRDVHLLDGWDWCGTRVAPRDGIDISLPGRVSIRWRLAVGGKTEEAQSYDLNFPTPELLRQANALAGKAVMVTGTFEGGVLKVKTIRPAAAGAR
jgi:hypothetical protein